MKVTNPNAGEYQNPLVIAEYNMGIRALAFNEFDEAENRFKATISHDASHALSYCRLGFLNQRKKLIEEAKQLYIKSIDLGEDTGLANRNLGLILGDEGDFKNAIYNLETATKLDPYDAETHFHLGLAYLQMKRYFDGKSSLLHAKEITEDKSLKNTVDQLLAKIPE